MIRKQYLYKVYQANRTLWDAFFWDVNDWDAGNNSLITTWSDDVISEPSFSESINTGPGELKVQLARSFSDFGEGFDVELRLQVDLYAYDVDTPNGQLIYSGYISQYSPNYRDNRQWVDVTLLPYSAEFSNYILEASGSTTIVYNSYDPSAILRDVINKYRNMGGKINYTASSIQNTNTTVSYTFQNNSVKEIVDKIVELCPENWYSYVDATNTIYLRQHKSENEAADHVLGIGQHVGSVKAIQDVERVINRVYFVGGAVGGDQLYLKSSRTGSIDGYGLQARKIVDTRVTDTTTATIMMNRQLDYNDTPSLIFEISVVDNNGTDSTKGYDLESIMIGHTVDIRGLFSGEPDVTRWDSFRWDEDFWDARRVYNLTKPQVVVRKNYSKNQLNLSLTEAVPLTAKRIEDIRRNLTTEQLSDIPVAPTEV